MKDQSDMFRVWRHYSTNTRKIIWLCKPQRLEILLGTNVKTKKDAKAELNILLAELLGVNCFM